MDVLVIFMQLLEQRKESRNLEFTDKLSYVIFIINLRKPKYSIFLKFIKTCWQFDNENLFGLSDER